MPVIARSFLRKAACQRLNSAAVRARKPIERLSRSKRAARYGSVVVATVLDILVLLSLQRRWHQPAFVDDHLAVQPQAGTAAADIIVGARCVLAAEATMRGRRV